MFVVLMIVTCRMHFGLSMRRTQQARSLPQLRNGLSYSLPSRYWRQLEWNYEGLKSVFIRPLWRHNFAVCCACCERVLFKYQTWNLWGVKT